MDIGVGGIGGHSHKGLRYGEPGYFKRVLTVHEVSAVTGACLLIRRSVFEDVGGFDEELPGSFNDVDLCLKVRSKGHRILYTPWSMLYHHESLSRGLDNGEKAEFAVAVNLVKNRWGGVLQTDPYFNQNFSRNSEHYSIKG